MFNIMCKCSPYRNKSNNNCFNNYSGNALIMHEIVIKIQKNIRLSLCYHPNRKNSPIFIIFNCSKVFIHFNVTFSHFPKRHTSFIFPRCHLTTIAFFGKICIYYGESYHFVSSSNIKKVFGCCCCSYSCYTAASLVVVKIIIMPFNVVQIVWKKTETILTELDNETFILTSFFIFYFCCVLCLAYYVFNVSHGLSISLQCIFTLLRILQIKILLSYWTLGFTFILWISD